MTLKLNSGKILVKKRLFDSFNSLAFYVFLTVVLLLIVYLFSEFIDSIGTSGIELETTPFLNIVQKFLGSTFGEIVIVNTFSKGPLKLIYDISFALIISYFSVFTIIEISGEIQNSAYEMLLYGPFTSKIYIISTFISIIVNFIIVSLIFLIFSFMIALASNIYLDWNMAIFFINSIFLFSSIASFSLFIVSAIKKLAPALLAFFGIVVSSFLIQMVTLSTISGSIVIVLSYIGMIFQWVSPFFYFIISIKAIETGNILLLFTAYIASTIFTILFIYLGTHYLEKRFE